MCVLAAARPPPDKTPPYQFRPDRPLPLGREGEGGPRTSLPLGRTILGPMDGPRRATRGRHSRTFLGPMAGGPPDGGPAPTQDGPPTHERPTVNQFCSPQAAGTLIDAKLNAVLRRDKALAGWPMTWDAQQRLATKDQTCPTQEAATGADGQTSPRDRFAQDESQDIGTGYTTKRAFAANETADSQYQCQHWGCPRRATRACGGWCNQVYCEFHSGPCMTCLRGPYCGDCKPSSNHTCVPDRPPPDPKPPPTPPPRTLDCVQAAPHQGRPQLPRTKLPRTRALEAGTANHWQTPEEAHSARPQGRGEAQSMLSWLVFGENPGPLLEDTTHTSALERIAAWGDLAAGRLGRGGDASPARGRRD